MRKIDRFLQYLDFKAITENRATIECGLSQGLLHQAKSGKSDLGYEYTIKLQVSSNQRLISDNIKHFTLFARISYQISDELAL